jgi:hypothetical protein
MKKLSKEDDNSVEKFFKKNNVLGISLAIDVDAAQQVTFHGPDYTAEDLAWLNANSKFIRDKYNGDWTTMPIVKIAQALHETYGPQFFVDALQCLIA